MLLYKSSVDKNKINQKQEDILLQRQIEKSIEGLSDKKRLNKAFAILRKNGYTAKQNVGCCGSCISSELQDQGVSDNYIFTTKQDNDFDKKGNLISKHHLDWSGDGVFITKVMELHGFNVEWSGNNSYKIAIGNNRTRIVPGIICTLSENAYNLKSPYGESLNLVPGQKVRVNSHIFERNSHVNITVLTTNKEESIHWTKLVLPE